MSCVSVKIRLQDIVDESKLESMTGRRSVSVSKEVRQLVRQIRDHQENKFLALIEKKDDDVEALGDKVDSLEAEVRGLEGKLDQTHRVLCRIGELCTDIKRKLNANHITLTFEEELKSIKEQKHDFSGYEQDILEPTQKYHACLESMFECLETSSVQSDEQVAKAPVNPLPLADTLHDYHISLTELMKKRHGSRKEHDLLQQLGYCINDVIQYVKRSDLLQNEVSNLLHNVFSLNHLGKREKHLRQSIADLNKEKNIVDAAKTDTSKVQEDFRKHAVQEENDLQTVENKIHREIKSANFRRNRILKLLSEKNESGGDRVRQISSESPLSGSQEYDGLRDNVWISEDEDNHEKDNENNREESLRSPDYIKPEKGSPLHTSRSEVSLSQLPKNKHRMRRSDSVPGTDAKQQNKKVYKHDKRVSKTLPAKSTSRTQSTVYRGRTTQPPIENTSELDSTTKVISQSSSNRLIRGGREVTALKSNINMNGTGMGLSPFNTMFTPQQRRK